MTPADVAVVIPTLNEAPVIAASIESGFAAGALEVIVSDGGSEDQTVEVAKGTGVSKIVRSLPGRGIQLNAGAAVTEKPWLLFLHADNRLDRDCLKQMCQEPDLNWGAFRQHIDSPRPLFRLVERGNAWRVKLRSMAFGDQAIFVRRDLFRQQGGFAEISLMEDVVLSQRLRQISDATLLPGPVTISPRRWQQNGIVRQTLRNWSIQLAFKFGASPERLRRHYG